MSKSLFGAARGPFKYPWPLSGAPGGATGPLANLWALFGGATGPLANLWALLGQAVDATRADSFLGRCTSLFGAPSGGFPARLMAPWELVCFGNMYWPSRQMSYYVSHVYSNGPQYFSIGLYCVGIRYASEIFCLHPCDIITCVLLMYGVSRGGAELMSLLPWGSFCTGGPLGFHSFLELCAVFRRSAQHAGLELTQPELGYLLN